MAETIKVLAQSAPSATTLTDVYTATGVTAVVSSIVICNRGAGSSSFRLSVAVGGAADSNPQYLYYDIPLSGNDTFIATIGMTLAANDKIRVYVGTGNFSINVFGTEIA